MIKSEHILTMVIVALLGGFLYLMVMGYIHESNMPPAEQEARSHRNRCISKVRGSRPACWEKEDWEAEASERAHHDRGEAVPPVPQ